MAAEHQRLSLQVKKKQVKAGARGEPTRVSWCPMLRMLGWTVAYEGDYPELDRVHATC